MKVKKHTLLWIGDIAYASFNQLKPSLKNECNHRFLLFDEMSECNEEHTKRLYSSDQPIEYEIKPLFAAYSIYRESQKEPIDLMIGSPMERIVESALQYEIKQLEPERNPMNEVKELLFSENLYKKNITPVISNFLLIKSNGLFEDISRHTENVIEEAKTTLNNVDTLDVDGDINQALFKYTE
jgi:hypothetical protein